MDCSQINHQIDIPPDAKKLVIAGNPNVGKSIFFNYFTGLYVTVSNYPGTTLDISSGQYKDYVVLDTPGVYGVSSFNEEEVVARDVILDADIVVNIVDAVHLERDLFLTRQIIDMGKPVVVALNMMDEANDRGLSIDVPSLKQELGVPVIPTIAPTHEGFSDLEQALSEVRPGHSIFKERQDIYRELQELTEITGNQAHALLIMEGDPHVACRHDLEPLSKREEIYNSRREQINELIDTAVSKENKGKSFKSILSSLMLKPLTGIPLLFLVLYALYQLVGVFIAQVVVDFTEGIVFIGHYEPFMKGLVGKLFAPSSVIGQILIGEFGVLTMTVTYTFGLLLPLVAGFYLFLSLLEDSGYMPRIAALVDRMLTMLGLNGRAIIPMLLGFGCVTMATITTRLLGSERERIIAIFLLGLAIPCSAQLGVIAGLIAPLGIKYFLIYIITIFAVYVLAGTFLNRVLPGKSTDLLIDLPPLRLPDIKNVLQKTYIKSRSFIMEAGPVFAAGSLVITLLKEGGILELIQRGAGPIIEGWLRLPGETATAFIMGIVRRDFGAAGLSSLSLTPSQTTVALITITLFVPCVAAMMIMIKERSWKDAAAIWAGSWITAFAVGGIVSLLI